MAQIFYNRLPRGLHLVQNEDGTASILGVPDDLPGYYRFSIRCEDSNKNIAIRDYEIEVVWTDDFNSNTIQRYTLNTSGTASPTISDSELDFTVSNDSHSSLTYKDRQDLKNGEIGIELSEADDTGIVIAFLNDSDYYAIVVYDASSAIIAKRNTIELIKKTGSTYSSPLATSSISFTRGNNHTIHSTTNNGIIKAFFDNTEVWSYDTGNINLEGAMGPRANRSPSIFDKFWYRTQDMVSFVDGDYPQPPLDLAINGYVPSSWAYNDYESSTVELIGTPPFILETDNLPPTYSAVVNGNYVEISGPPLPTGDYTFRLIAKDSSNNTAILPVTMQMLAMEWTMEEIVDDSVEIIGGNGIFVGVFLYGGSLPNGVTYSLDGTNIKLSGKPSGLVDKDRGSAVFKVIDSDNEETLVKIGWELNYDVEWKPIHMDNAPKIWVGHESDIVDDFGVCSEIENKGTLGGIFSQTTNANRPAILYESDVGIRALRFDGSNDYIQGESGFNWISLLSGVENAWSFTTYKSDTVTATDRYPFRINHSSNNNIRYSSIASDTSYANRPGIGGRSQVSPMDNYSSIYAGITVGNDWTTSFQRIDYPNKTGYIRVNGGNEASNILSNMTADVSQNVTSSVPYIGSFNNGYFSGDISQVIFGVGDIKQYDIDRAEGYSMHVSGLNDGLPSNHPFRQVPPYTGTPKLNFDNNEGNLVYGFITTSDNGNVGVSKGDDNFGTFFNDGPMLGVGENFSLIYTDSTLLIFESSDIDSTVNEAVLYDYKGLKLATIPLSYSSGKVYGSTGYALEENEIYYVRFGSVTHSNDDIYVNENSDGYVNQNVDNYFTNSRALSSTIDIFGSLSDWTVGVEVTDTLLITGGSGIYSSVAVTEGSLPDGVSAIIDGNVIEFIGEPSVDGNGEATLSITDNIGNYGVYTLTWNVLRLWTPADLIVAPKIWLDWDSSVSITPGYGVNEWENHGSLGDAFTQTSVGIQPSELPAELNGLRVLRFDDAALINNSPSFRAMCQDIENCTIFSVFRRINSGTSYVAQAILTFGVGTGAGTPGRCCAYAGTGSGNNNKLGHLMRARDGDAASTNYGVSDIGTNWTIAVWAADYIGGQSDVFRDGVLISSVPTLRAEKTANTISIRPVTIGQEPNPSNSRLRGEIACLIAFDAALSIGDRQRLEGWAAHLCGLQSVLPSNHPYRYSPPVVST